MNKKSNLSEMQVILKEFENGLEKPSVEKFNDYILKYPDDNIAKYNLSVILEKIGDTKNAIINYENIIIKEPNHWQSKLNLCLLYFHINKFNEALSLINDVLKIKPNYQSALREKGHILYKLNDLEGALDTIIVSVKLNTKDYIALNIMGMIYSGLKNFKLAASIYQKAIEINKNYYASYSNISKCLVELNKREKAISYLKKCLDLKPGFIEAINNLANIYNSSANYDKAIELYTQILQRNKNHPDVNLNIAIAYFHNKEYDNANNFFEICKKINPDNDKFKKNYSYFLLYKQQYKKAWEIADGRLDLQEFIKRGSWIENFKNKIWNGEKLHQEDKILIVKEQGIGDEILYSTMYPEALRYFSNIQIEVEKRLLTIFQKSYGNEEKFLPAFSISNDKEKLKDIKKVIFSASLARLFRNSKESFPKKNILKTDDKIFNKIKIKLEKISKNKKVGISWKSKRVFFGEAKSIDLSFFSSIFNNKSLTFINLQYGEVDEDILRLKKDYNIEIINLKEIDLFNDFEATSSLLKNLDLFISVSNSTAHLAGALNVETLLIKPKANAIFHYWNQPSDSTPWYPSIKLIEQTDNNEKMIKEINKILINKFNL
jgi:tetratricopeptide (TPR) repeat protein